MPDKDRHNPKEAEERMLLQYINNYMNVDPRTLSEKEKMELM